MNHIKSGFIKEAATRWKEELAKKVGKGKFSHKQLANELFNVPGENKHVRPGYSDKFHDLLNKLREADSYDWLVTRKAQKGVPSQGKTIEQVKEKLFDKDPYKSIAPTKREKEKIYL